MKAVPGDPWINSFLRRPDVRTKISFFFFYVQVVIYLTLLSGLLLFVYLILTRTG
jgi:hypothetical protein